ncbi:hypothetical protein GEMRC1_012871 [Eukaryota sp. GEM-RC1]
MTSIEEDENRSSTTTLMANFDSNVWLITAKISDDDSTMNWGLFFDGSNLFLLNDVCAPENPAFLEEIGSQSVNKMHVNPSDHEKVGQLDYQGSKCNLYNVDPAKNLDVCLYDGFVAMTCDGGLDLSENCQIFTDQEELSSNDDRFTLEHHCHTMQKTTFSASFHVDEELNNSFAFDSEECDVDDVDIEFTNGLQFMKITIFTTDTHETKQVLGQQCTVFTTVLFYTIDLCIHDGFVLEQCLNGECVQFSEHQETSTDHASFTPPDYCYVPGPIEHVHVFSADSYDLFSEVTIENAYFNLDGYEREGIKNFYDYNYHYAVDSGSCLKEDEWETGRKVLGMSIDDNHEFLGTETVNGIECTNYEYETWDLIRTCLSKDGFILKYCFDMQCSTLSNHQEVSSSHANFELPSACAPDDVNQVLYFAATLRRSDGETIESARFNLDSQRMWWEDAGQEKHLSDPNVYSIDETSCAAEEDIFLTQFLIGIKFPSQDYDFVDDDVIDGVACNRYSYSIHGMDVTNCIADGFDLELCMWTACSTFASHSTVSADGSKFSLPSHC